MAWGLGLKGMCKDELGTGAVFSVSAGQSWASALKCWAPRLCGRLCLQRQLNLSSSLDLFAICTESSVRGCGLEHAAGGRGVEPCSPGLGGRGAGEAGCEAPFAAGVLSVGI